MTQEMVAEVEGHAPSTRQVSFTFSDGAERTVAVRPGQTVLAAAHEQGMPLASQCRIGTCQTCVGMLESGSADMPDDLITALTKAEIAGGQRLLCQTTCDTDAKFRLEYPSKLLDANPSQLFEAKIARLTWLADSVVELELKLPKGLKFGFTAGQYCRLRVPGSDEWRSYSMASGEHEKGKVTFLIRVLPSGLMSDFLRTSAAKGVSLEVEGPLGSFVLEPSERPHLLMAGGTGLAPMLSMLDRLRLVRPTPPVLVVFGCVSESDLFHLEELQIRASLMPSLQVRVVLENETSVPDVLRGNPVSVLSPEDVPADAVAYLCGPPGMIRAAEQKLTEFGLASADVRSEQFLAS